MMLNLPRVQRSGLNSVEQLDFLKNLNCCRRSLFQTLLLKRNPNVIKKTIVMNKYEEEYIKQARNKNLSINVCYSHQQIFQGFSSTI